MAYQTIWYNTEIPEEIIDILEKDINNYDGDVKESRLHGNLVNEKIRRSKNSWIPSTHWISGFIWHYVQMANRKNFLYDISNIDNESLQYTHYTIGDYYKWHSDGDVSNLYKPISTTNNDLESLKIDEQNKKIETVRKISFVLQLSDPSEYEGGNLQILGEDGKSYFAPRSKGTVILFDSRAKHRVLKVTKGLRKSIVGWVVGPRWK